MADAKLDLKKELKAFYAPAKGFSLVEVPPISFLMIDGKGAPTGDSPYAEAVAALYAVAYGAKFALKKTAQHPDFSVPPLEALWWAEDYSVFATRSQADWEWTVMIAMPDFVTEADIMSAAEVAAKKKDLPAIGGLRFERFEEGLAAQTLYVGPYSDEGPTIAALHQFIADNGKTLRGKHHEIYLSDPRKTDPSKLKTIIRQPAG